LNRGSGVTFAVDGVVFIVRVEGGTARPRTHRPPYKHGFSLHVYAARTAQKYANVTSQTTRFTAKPNASPPGCAASRLRPATPISSVDKANKNWLPWQRTLRDQKK